MCIRARFAVGFALLACVGCAARHAGPSLTERLASHGVGIDALSARPTESERELVRADWGRRDTAAYDVRVEARYDLPSSQVMLIISHQTPAGRHFGALLAPTAALEPGRSTPVLLNLHGLGRELTLKLPDPGDAATPPTAIITVWPSFSGESLRFRDATWTSDGNPWDFCDGASDDAIRFLNAALEALPGADSNRIVAFGGSRGGTVAMLVALRDERVRRAIAMSSPTDFFDMSLLSHENASVLYGRWLLLPILDGSGAVSDARDRMLRCSPAQFASDLPPTQLHAGTADRSLPWEQTRHLEQTLGDMGRSDFEAHYYEGGDHDLSAHQGMVRDRVRAWAAPVFSAD